MSKETANPDVVKEAVELPSFRVNRDGLPDEKAIRAYEEDGVVCLRGAFSKEWVDLLDSEMEEALGVPYPSEYAFTVAEPDEPGFFFVDSLVWQRFDQFKRFAFDSPAPDIAQRIMRTQGLVFYFDAVFQKNPGTTRETPWHYDETYWPLTGTQSCNMWTAVDPVPKAAALYLVRGSHKWTTDYNPAPFGPDISYANLPDRPAPPAWHKRPGDHEIVYAELDRGDCMIFNFRTHHFAPGNTLQQRRRTMSTHWAGDDITYDDKPYQTDPYYRGEGLVPGGSIECESFPRVR